MSVFNRIKSRLLYKYIVSYLLVFLVPFMVMSMIIYYNSVSSLRQGIEQSNINKLEQVESITDERMSELGTLAARISYDPRLTPYMMSHDYYSGEAIDELKKYKANSSIIEELFVYYHADDTLYSTGGSYSIDTLLKRKYQFDSWGIENIAQDLHTKLPLIKPTENVIVNNNNEERMIAYLFPIAPNNPNPYGTVMYFIKESVITDLIQNILGEFEGNAYIFNDSDEIVAANINDDEIKQEDLTVLTNNGQKIANVVINGKDYSLTSVKSENSEWTFVTVMGADQFFKKLENTKTLIVVILVVLLLVGLILAVLLGRNQYKPIRNLIEITNKNGRRSTGYVNGNELETIQNTMANVFKDQQTLNETMYMQRPFAREQLLVKLLKGDIKTNEEIETLLNSLNIKMKKAHFFVAIIYFEKGTFKADHIEERDKVFDLLLELELMDATAYGVDLLYNDALALVVSIDQVENKVDSRRQMVVPEIQQYMQGTLQVKPTIGVGRLYDEKRQINHSYIEALATMEYKFLNPQGSIIYFEDISSQPEQALGYPKDEQIRLVQSLKQGDQVVAGETLDNMFKQLAEKNMSVQVSKCICFDIINTIVKTVSELGLSEYVENFNHIVDFNSTEQLRKQLHTVVMKISKEVEGKKESHNDKLRKEILTYIKANYNLYELTLEKIAVDFQLSVSYLSRFIKDQTGVTFTQYVQDIRIAHVKKQLKETDQSIKQIVTGVGYKDVANFTRKFKKIIGITPGQYRTLNK